MKKLFLALMALVLAVLTLAPAGQSRAAEANIVDPSVTYTYGVLTQDIRELAAKYPDLIEYKSIGKTLYGRDIWAVGLGSGSATVFFNGSHHAREWLTTTLNMYMIEQYAKAYSEGRKFEGYDVHDILGKTKIWFVPMVNPDGVTLQQTGLQSFPASVHKALIAMNDGSRNFKRWKANAQGVDPNRQYDANWKELLNNYAYPHWMGHKGTAPMTAKENKAMIAFTYEIDPEIAVSYHSAGRILYWNFRTPAVNYKRDKRLADIFRSFTGYSLVSPSYNSNGGGGYTDWFIQKLGRPAFTPEIGIKNGETNLSVSAFSEEWRRNKKIGLWIAQEGYALWAAKHKTTVKPVSLFLDGRRIEGAPAAFNEDGTTYAAYKPLLTGLGYVPVWDAATKSVTATGARGTLQFALGKKEASADGKPIALTAAPRLYEGALYVPVRLISQATGASLTVQAESGAVSVKSPAIVTAKPTVPAVPTTPVNKPAEPPVPTNEPAVPGTVDPQPGEEPVVPGTVDPEPESPSVPGTVVPNP
ncbi:gamma-D-glutamyl-meso-diaminopimelate peptidase [Saccharibacillus sp. O23]|uniref:M14 family zinc carboxypeptidase n=1 Tax=Saccharibacillus sp. O23 TaxID=2009338 RepID=UPI000B4E0F91|nr:M14 family zinc carboxypeptidase [Saccharibacillus sp. O23]OWR31214.1 gamma-D-glutamyl-meso-diaminopimelate peptidase [Saccharibacillus sp. O23]